MCSKNLTKTEKSASTGLIGSEERAPLSVNIVLSDRCNYRCKFCFARFSENKRTFSHERILEIPCILVRMGASKITVEGGEPFLFPELLKKFLIEAKRCGLTTMVISNGSLITREFLEEIAPYLDWLGLSVDSPHEETEKKLGRGFGNHVKKALQVAQWCHELGIRLKVNSVITRYNVSDDLVGLILEMRPERVKFFQYLHIKGSNDEFSEELTITEEEFEDFVRRHRILESYGIDIAFEKNEDMRGSYLMLMPDGRFFNNNDGTYHFTEHNIFRAPEIALEEARWDVERFLKRGGLYDWKKEERK